MESLRAVGALSSPQGPATQLDEDAFGPALIGAALACASDVPFERRRFLVPDRRQSQLVADELQALVALTLAGPKEGRHMVDAVRDEIARRQEDLARAEPPARSQAHP